MWCMIVFACKIFTIISSDILVHETSLLKYNTLFLLLFATLICHVVYNLI